jgi:aspartyl-tRNA(Asn)/glutamyl-tRNA(Gln) amidotransferase subunit C
MAITRAEVLRVAQLARLELADSEQEAFGKQLDQILLYVQKLKTFDTEGVEATSTVLEQVNVFRPDEVRPSLSVDEALANAPVTQESYFQVPRIIQES